MKISEATRLLERVSRQLKEKQKANEVLTFNIIDYTDELTGEQHVWRTIIVRPTRKRESS